MKIAYDYEICKNPTGIGRISRETLRNLCNIDSGRELEIYFFYNSFLHHKPTILSEIKPKFIATHFPLFIFRRFPSLQLQFRYKFIYPALCEKYGIEIFHGMENMSIINPNIISIMTVYDLFFLLEEAKCSDNYHRFMNHQLKFLDKYDKIIAVSENTKKDLLKNIRVNHDKVVTIYPGVGEEFYLLEKERRLESNFLASIKRKYSLPERYLLYCGNFVPRKNTPKMIDIFSEYKRHKKKDAKFVLAGPFYGKDYELVRGMVKRYGLEKDIFFLGQVEEDLPYLYYLADCLIFLSLYEGFGLPLVEAMAAGTPVVTANNSSLKEIAGEYALLVDPENISEVLAAIEEATQIKEGRKSFLFEAARYVRRFNWEEGAKRLLEVYRETYKNKRFKL